MRLRSSSCAIVVIALGISPLIGSPAQSPAPVVVQAATPAPPKPATAPANSGAAADAKPMLQLLQEMQATNAATLKKQQAALETLDALQKAAEEIKIFSKRG
jgi:cell division septation protein DedD